MNLLKYFTSREEDLPASYVRKCKKFFKEIEQRKGIKFAGKFKPQASKRSSLTGPKL
jgi:hypothetical protein